jgi:hypothetical protein
MEGDQICDGHHHGDAPRGQHRGAHPVAALIVFVRGFLAAFVFVYFV